MLHNFKLYALAHDPQEDQSAADDWFSDAVDSDVADDNCYGGNGGN